MIVWEPAQMNPKIGGQSIVFTLKWYLLICIYVNLLELVASPYRASQQSSNKEACGNSKTEALICKSCKSNNLPGKKMQKDRSPSEIFGRVFAQVYNGIHVLPKAVRNMTLHNPLNLFVCFSLPIHISMAQAQT